MLNTPFNFVAEDTDNTKFHIHGSVEQSPIKTDKAVIMLHGLGCSSQMAAFPKATSLFRDREFDVIHFDLNGNKSGARPTTSVNLETFAFDTSKVIDRIGGHYETLFAVGHSYGGAAIVLANPDIKAASLWDAIYALPEDQSWVADYTKPLGPDRFLPDWNPNVVLHRQLLEVEKKYDRAKCREMAEKCRFPVQSLLTENFNEAIEGESFDTYSPHPTSCRTVYHGQDHFFEEKPEDTKDMIERTIAFFEAH